MTIGQRPGTDIVRLRPLLAAGADRAGRQHAEPHHLHVDLAAQDFAGQDFAVPDQPPRAVDIGFTQHGERAAAAGLAGALRTDDLLDLFRALPLPRRKESPRLRHHFETVLAQPVRKRKREIGGNQKHTAPQHRGDPAQNLKPVPAELGLGVHLDVPRSRVDRAAVFERRHDDSPACAVVEVDELVGRGKSGRVPEIGALLAGGDDQTNDFMHFSSPVFAINAIPRYFIGEYSIPAGGFQLRLREIFMNLEYFIVPAASYLIGSIPFGYLIGRLHGIDIRKVGSGNIGATNVTRSIGKIAGKICFFLDFLKGALPVVLVNMTFEENTANLALAAGLAVILGHVFPIYLRFRGGKGVATAAGVALALAPYPLLCALAVWVVTFLTSRYVSLASIVAAASLPIIAALFFGLGIGTPFPLANSTVFFFALIAFLAILRHISNIKRLLNGTENRFDSGAGKRGSGK